MDSLYTLLILIKHGKTSAPWQPKKLLIPNFPTTFGANV